jgi:PqqD family protein of HPr-rel-A system
MEKQPRIRDIAISDAGFVFDPFSGATFTLNATGQLIVKALRDGLSQEEIMARLRTEFDGVTHKVDEDLQDFMRTLKEFSLLADAE